MPPLLSKEVRAMACDACGGRLWRDAEGAGVFCEEELRSPAEGRVPRKLKRLPSRKRKAVRSRSVKVA